MSNRPDDTIPNEVLHALEALETASSPTSLGPHYQVLLDWRRQNSLGVFSRNAAQPVTVLCILVASFAALQLFDFEVSEFWRGVSYGMMIAVLIVSMRDWFFPPHRPPPTIAARIEAAIDRWRHAVPAMKEIPK